MPQTTELPGVERIRVLTADPNLAPATATEHARMFLQAGKLPIAMMFLERSKDVECMDRVKTEAVRMGDAFLLQWIDRLAADLVKPADWTAAGDRAFADGKFLFARDCFEKAGEAGKAKAAHEAWLKIFPAPAAPTPRV